MSDVFISYLTRRTNFLYGSESGSKMSRPTLGIYGPKNPERAGAADYISLSLSGLSEYFACTHVSNRDWRDPREFDYVLYHIGNNRFHECAFRALKIRAGPAIIHEHNCLQYYWERWIEGSLDPEDELGLLKLFSRKLGKVSNKKSIYSLLVGLNEIDPFTVDIGVERLFIANVTIAFTHSRYYQKQLKDRYPDLRIIYIPFMVEPFDKIEIDKARRCLNLEPGDYLFGTYGFISGEYKRVDKIIAAWQNWNTKPPHAKLLILGENQIGIDIPQSPDIIHIGYVEDIRRFDAFVGASNCAIQLRYPTCGETSGVISRIIANGKLLITSDTDYNSIYKGNKNVLLVKPDEHEIENLITAFSRAMCLTPSLKYNQIHNPRVCARKLYEEIVGARR